MVSVVYDSLLHYPVYVCMSVTMLYYVYTNVLARFVFTVYA